jgi:hypothetical protein
LPPVSTTLLKLVEKFDAGVVDTGGAPWLPNISVNFRKIWNALNGILWAGGKLIHEKNQEQKISWHYPFKVILESRRTRRIPTVLSFYYISFHSAKFLPSIIYPYLSVKSLVSSHHNLCR